MHLIVTVIHFIVALSLIFVVLLQKGSGDMGSAFGGGGGSDSVFGSRGSGSFMGKMTAVLAAVFMLTSLTLAFYATGKARSGGSLLDKLTQQQEQEAPVPAKVPAAAPALDVKSDAPAAPAEAAPVEAPAKAPAPAPADGFPMVPKLAQ